MVRIRIGDDERELDWDEWERRVRDGRIPPDALVNLEALTGEAFVPAKSLESYQSLRNEAALAWQSRFQAAPPPIATALLVGINLRIWWIARLPYPRAWLDVNLSNWTAPILEDGESWRALTMGMLHLGTPHVAMNMLWLAYTGWNLERAMGRLNLVLLYGCSVLGGSVLSMFLSPEARSLGASGGVFGLVAAAVVFGFLRPELLPSRGRRVFGLALLPYLVVMFFSGLVNEGIDNWSHFGGLVTGGTLALVLDPDGLERSPGWNRGWRLGLAGFSAATLLLLGLFGPRIAPIAPHERVEASLRAEPATPAVEELVVRPKALSWDAPSGWRLGVTSTGETGFASPSPRGDRAWAVHEDVADAPQQAGDRAEKWAAGVRETFADAVVDPPVEASLGGWPGLTVRAHLPNDIEVQWWGAARGRYGIEAVWQVEAARESRLAPLRDRLVGAVRWDDPPALTDALALVDRNPKSIRARADLAKALADVGRATDALTLFSALVADDPENPDHTVGLLRVIAWYPGVVADPEPYWTDALARNPTGEVVVAVADGLHAWGRSSHAEGLLDVGWAKLPGDKALRRALRARGMPTDIDATTHLPRHLVVDASGRPLPPREVQAIRDMPLDLDAAEHRAFQRDADRAELTRQALQALQSDPSAAADPLLLLQLGAPPIDVAAARAALAEDLRTVERGGTVKWLPDSLASHIVPGTADRIVPPTGR